MDLRRARALMDEETLAHLTTVTGRPDFVYESLADETIQNRFLDAYRRWISRSAMNRVIGLDQFPACCYSQGTTESFGLFYQRHKQRRMRCLRGEYFYHHLSWRNHFEGWQFVDEEHALCEGDAFVISLPFADTGNQHPATASLLEQCDRLAIPVLLDCVYFGLCRDIEVDVRHPSIDVVTFSLSKCFPVAHARVGMRLTRIDDDDPLFFMNKAQYTNRIGASLGLAFLDRFGPDYNQERWRDRQLQACQRLSVEPSHCVLFGLGGPDYAEYNRGGVTNRLSLNDFLEESQGGSA